MDFYAYLKLPPLLLNNSSELDGIIMNTEKKSNSNNSKSKCDDILQCVLSLNPLEVTSYKTLVKKGPMKAEELGALLGKDRSTAYRCLKRLILCGICIKETHYMKKGGHYHIYAAVPPLTVKTKLKEHTEDWYQHMCEAIEGFPYE